MADAQPQTPKLRVRSLRPRRRRAGLDFTREPRDLTADELGGENVAGFTSLLALLDDPQLSCSFVLEDGAEQVITAEKVAQLREALASWQAAEAEADAQRSMLANPATAELARKLLADGPELQPASGAVGEAGGATASPAEPTAARGDQAYLPDGAAQAAGTVTSGLGSEEASSSPVEPNKNTAPEGSQPAGEEVASPAAEASAAKTEPTAEPAAAPRRGKQRSH